MSTAARPAAGDLPYGHVFLPRVERMRKLPLLFLRTIGLVWRSGRRQLLITTSLQVTQGVGVVAQLLLAKRVLDAFLGEPASGIEFSDVVPQLAMLVGLTVCLSFAGAIQVEQSRVLGELVARSAYDRVLDVAGAVELEAFESSTFFDRLQRAVVGGLTRPLQMVVGLGTMVTSLVTLTGITVALVALQPWLVPILFLGYAPLWYASTRNSKALFKFGLDLAEDDRERGYLQRVLIGRAEAKEVRAFDLAPLLRERYDQLYDHRIQKLRHLAARRTVRSLLASVGTSGLMIVALAVLGYLYVEGRMDLAAVGATVAALLQLNSRLRGLSDGAGVLYESALFIDDYESFLELAPALPALEGDAKPLPAFRRFRAERLSFTYPGSTTPAVDGVSIEIKQGEVVALVGENGSGKTTLAKLLAHLYRPTGGRILWDDVDTADKDPEAVRRRIAVVFQDFARYLLPARENIGAGRRERIEDTAAIIEAARRAGADSFLSRLPKGYDTVLGKEFTGGVDLSIGQWQRLALARAFFRDSPFVILDEPTAALDPRAEAELFDNIRGLFRGRTVLLISHRFSSVRSADRIYVLQRGRVVEHGAHEELMRRRGIYAELFTLQAAAYLDRPDLDDEPVPGGAWP